MKANLHAVSRILNRRKEERTKKSKETPHLNQRVNQMMTVNNGLFKKGCLTYGDVLKRDQ